MLSRGKHIMRGVMTSLNSSSLISRVSRSRTIQNLNNTTLRLYCNGTTPPGRGRGRGVSFGFSSKQDGEIERIEPELKDEYPVDEEFEEYEDFEGELEKYDEENEFEFFDIDEEKIRKQIKKGGFLSKKEILYGDMGILDTKPTAQFENENFDDVRPNFDDFEDEERVKKFYENELFKGEAMKYIYREKPKENVEENKLFQLVESEREVHHVAEDKTMSPEFFNENYKDEDTSSEYRRVRMERERLPLDFDERTLEMIKALRLKQVYSDEYLNENQALAAKIRGSPNIILKGDYPTPLDAAEYMPLHQYQEEEMDIIDTFEKKASEEAEIEGSKKVEEEQREVFFKHFRNRTDFNLMLARRRNRFKKWYEKSYERRKKMKEMRMIKRKLDAENQKALIEKYKNDPNYVYYRELDLYLSKEDLKDKVIRNAVSSIYKNPTWSNKDKKKFILSLKKTLNEIRNPTQEQLETISILYDFGEEKVETDTRLIDHILKLPITDWTQMIEELELEMDEQDKIEKYALTHYDKVQMEKEAQRKKQLEEEERLRAEQQQQQQQNQ